MVASPPAGEGSIVYMFDDANGNPQTWTACADLSHKTQLTAVPHRESGWPVWSPDGSRIAFDSDRADPDTTDKVVVNDVFTMKADGSDVRKLTDSVGLSGDPGYSPDGKLIAFEADRGDPATEGIFVMNAADGSGLRRVTTVKGGGGNTTNGNGQYLPFETAPRFSPDGTAILFNLQVRRDVAALVVVNLDGTGSHLITHPDLQPGDGVWSPDGTQVVFEAELVFDGRAGPWIVGADSNGDDARSLTGPQDVSESRNGFSDPVWSPDGTRILVLHGIHHADGSDTAGLAIVDADGSNLHYIGDGLGREHQADWTGARAC